MRINSDMKVFSNSRNVAFGVSCSKQVKKELNLEKQRIIDSYGENSPEYKEYKDCLKYIKTVCPNAVLSLRKTSNADSADKNALELYLKFPNKKEVSLSVGRKKDNVFNQKPILNHGSLWVLAGQLNVIDNNMFLFK